MRAIDLVNYLIERTEDLEICLFCDEYDDARVPRAEKRHGLSCPLGRFLSDGRNVATARRAGKLHD